jgi:hypothetical protein
MTVKMLSEQEHLPVPAERLSRAFVFACCGRLTLDVVEVNR